MDQKYIDRCEMKQKYIAYILPLLEKSRYCVLINYMYTYKVLNALFQMLEP